MAKELYVGHISDNASEEDIIKLFSVMGTVTSVHLIVDPETGEFKRCGYVRMRDVDLKEVAEALDGALLIDKVITVSIARPQKPGMSKSGKSGKLSYGRKPGFSTRTESVPKTAGKQKAGSARQNATGTKQSTTRNSSRNKTGTGAKPGGRSQTRTQRTK